MINRDLVHKLASQSRATPRPESDPRGAAVQETWQQAYVTLIRIVEAPTLEEFNRRSVGFNRAFRRFKVYLKGHKQDPVNSGRWFSDLEFGVAYLKLLTAVEDKIVSIVQGTAGFMGKDRVACERVMRINKMMRLAAYAPNLHKKT